MKYLTLNTKSLVDLAGRNEKEAINWENIGTSSSLISLTNLRNSFQENNKDGTTYFLPIANETKAQEFILKCSQYGITAELIEQTEAETRINTILASQSA